jgi:hypothetical protein
VLVCLADRVIAGVYEVADSLATGEVNKFPVAIEPRRRRRWSSRALSWACSSVVVCVSQFSVAIGKSAGELSQNS